MKTYPIIPIAIASVALAITAQAQPALSITEANTGFFRVHNPQLVVGDSCSQYSPQFSNYTGSIPSACRNTIQLWVSNTGNAPTAGPVTVTDTLIGSGIRSITVLGVNGTGWNCSASFNKVVCNRTAGDPLLPGHFYGAITITALIEDFAVDNLNNLVQLSGTGITPDTPGATFFDSSVSFAPPAPFAGILPIPSPYPVNPTALVTVHTVPEGQPVYVDGTIYSQIPHTFEYRNNSLYDWHNIQAVSGGGPTNPTLAPIPANGLLNNVFLTFPGPAVVYMDFVDNDEFLKTGLVYIGVTQLYGQQQ